MFQFTQTLFGLGKAAKTLGVFALALSLVNCTKQRDNYLPDELRESHLSLSLVQQYSDPQTPRLQIITGDVVQEGDPALALFEKPAVKVEDHNAPSQLEFLFRDLSVVAPAQANVDVVLKAMPASLVVYMVVDSSENLSRLQYQLLESAGNGKYLVPLFSHDVTSYGVLQSSTNALGETTSIARLSKVQDWAEATDVLINKSPSARKMVTVDPGSFRSVGERVFLESHFDGAVATAAELSSDYEINIGLSTDTPVYTMVNGNYLYIYEVTTRETGGLLEDQKQALRLGTPSDSVMACTEETAALIQVNEGDQCVHVARSRVPVEHVNATLTPNSLISNQVGSYSTFLTFQPSAPGETSGLVKISRNPLPEEVLRSNSNTLDPRQYFKVADLKEGEFLMRRMLQDVPNLVPGVFTTMTGPINIVKFRFLEGRVEAFRTDATLDVGVNNPTDFETLFSIGAQYFRMEYKDPSGRALSVPRLVDTSHTDPSPDLYVKMDWTKNEIEDSGSPLSTLGFSNGLCYSSSTSRVASVDNRLDEDGALSLTIEGKYAANPQFAQLCFGRYPGYSGFSNIYGGDGNYALNERVSFRRHNPAHDDFDSLDLPVIAQKAFNFGAVTRRSYNRTASGRAGILGTEKNLAVIHDFSDGKQIEFVLKGVPEALPYNEDDGSRKVVTRDQMVDAVREVVADWNDVLRRSFKGTPFETKKDLIVLKVDGVDVHTQIGDLDVNHIYIEPSATGVPYLGVYMGTPNPRSGLYEAGNVNVFAGNIMTSAENTKRASRIKKQYLAKHRATYEEAVRRARRAIEQGPGASIRPAMDQDALARTEGFLSNLTSVVAENQADNIYASFELSPHSVALGPYEAKVSAQDVMTVSDTLTALSSRNIPNWREFMQVVDEVSRTGVRNLTEDVLSAPALANFEGYEHLWIQKGIDLALEDIRKHGADPSFFERHLISSYLEFNGDQLHVQDIAQLTSRYQELTMMYLSQYGAHAETSCFYESMDEGSEILAEMPMDELFLSMFKHTTSHELGHALGLAHNFKGSFDESNFKFPDERNTKRRSSSIMEYGDSLERAFYSGPGPHDAYALRAIYTGLVEADPQILGTIQENAQEDPETGRKLLDIEVRSTGQKFPLWVHGGKFLQIDQLLEFLISKDAPEQISEFDVLGMGIPLRPYEFCSNGFEYYDPNCNMFDAGTTAEEIVDYYIGQYNASYELRTFIQDRTRFTIQNMLANVGVSAYYFHQTRRYMDDAMFRLVNNRGTSIFRRGDGNAQNIEEFKALESVKAAVKARAFLLSVVHTPDADHNSDPDARWVPFNVTVQERDGSIGILPLVVEKRYLYGSADNDYGYLNRSSYYFDKILGLNFLTQRSSSRDLDGDILAPRAFSFLDFERFYMGVDSIEKSLIGLTLAQILSDHLHPTYVPTENGAMFSIPLSSSYSAEIPGSLRFFAGLNAVLSLHVNTIQQDYNFGADFMVSSEIGAGRLSSNSNFLTDLSRDPGNSQVERFFAFEGEYAKVANVLVDQGSGVRALMDQPMAKQIEDLTIARLDLGLRGEAVNVELSQEAIQDAIGLGTESEETLELLNENLKYNELRTQLIHSLAEAFDGTEAAAAEEVAMAEALVDDFLSLAPQIGPLLQSGQMQIVNNLMDSFRNRVKAHPSLAMVATSIQDALMNQKVDTSLARFSPDALLILPTKSSLEVRYGLMKSNMELLHIFTTILKPSARSY